jgi:hypothetical protein
MARTCIGQHARLLQQRPAVNHSHWQALRRTIRCQHLRVLWQHHMHRLQYSHRHRRSCAQHTPHTARPLDSVLGGVACDGGEQAGAAEDIVDLQQQGQHQHCMVSGVWLSRSVPVGKAT